MRFPYGAIKYIFEVGLVRKKSKTYVQDSVDRIIGFETKMEPNESDNTRQQFDFVSI